VDALVPAGRPPVVECSVCPASVSSNNSLNRANSSTIFVVGSGAADVSDVGLFTTISGGFDLFVVVAAGGGGGGGGGGCTFVNIEPISFNFCCT